MKEVEWSAIVVGGEREAWRAHGKYSFELNLDVETPSPRSIGSTCAGL